MSYNTHRLLLFITCLATISFFSCKKDEEIKPTPQPTTEYYFFAKLDTKDITIGIGTSNEVDMLNANQISENGGLCKVGFGSLVVCTATGSTNPDQPDFGLELLDYFSGPCDELAPTFPSLLMAGSYGFGSGPGKIQVSMWDGTEKWISDPTRQPSDAFIQVSESIEVTWLGKPARKLIGKGSCVLYDSNGNSKKLTDLRFSVAIERP